MSTFCIGLRYPPLSLFELRRRSQSRSQHLRHLAREVQVSSISVEEGVFEKILLTRALIPSPGIYLTARL